MTMAVWLAGWCMELEMVVVIDIMCCIMMLCVVENLMLFSE